MDIEKTIKENENLIYKIASKYSMYYSYDDLFQVGSIGIIKAINNFDKESNAKFSSYAYKYILGEMIDFIRRDRNIIVSDEIFSVYKKYIKIRDLLINKYEREPTIKEISDFIGVEEEYLIRIIESVTFTKTIDDDIQYYVDERDDIENKILLESELALLNLFDRKIINCRYYQGFSQSETAQLLGTSQVKVSRQERLILSKIKDRISN